MSEPESSSEVVEGNEDAVRAAFAELLSTERRCPFGPRFFLEQIPAFLRDHCPDPEERLPRLVLSVQGEAMLVCHIVAVAPRWVAVAVREETESGRMRTELVPYEAISRVTVGGTDAASRHLGFDVAQRPKVVEAARTEAEEALAAAAGLRQRASERR